MKLLLLDSKLSQGVPDLYGITDGVHAVVHKIELLIFSTSIVEVKINISRENAPHVLFHLLPGPYYFLATLAAPLVLAQDTSKSIDKGAYNRLDLSLEK